MDHGIGIVYPNLGIEQNLKFDTISWENCRYWGQRTKYQGHKLAIFWHSYVEAKWWFNQGVHEQNQRVKTCLGHTWTKSEGQNMSGAYARVHTVSSQLQQYVKSRTWAAACGTCVKRGKTLLRRVKAHAPRFSTARCMSHVHMNV